MISPQAETAVHPFPDVQSSTGRDHLKQRIAQLEARLADRRRDLRERMLSSALMRLPRTATADDITALADRLIAYVEQEDASANPAPVLDAESRAAMASFASGLTASVVATTRSGQSQASPSDEGSPAC